MSSIELSALAGIVLSLLMSYIPSLREWFAAKDSTTKSLIMGLLLLVVTVGALLYNCNLGTACITSNWHTYAVALFAALVANQSTYSISPQTNSVKAINAAKPVPVAPAQPAPVASVEPPKA